MELLNCNACHAAANLSEEEGELNVTQVITANFLPGRLTRPAISSSFIVFYDSATICVLPYKESTSAHAPVLAPVLTRSKKK